MHELSIANAVVESVCEAVPDGQRVHAVHLEVGALSGVVEDALRFSWELATEGTPLQGARLEIELVKIQLFCCGETFEPDSPWQLVCPRCGLPCGDLRRGRELSIKSLEVSDATAYSRA